jgi:hypothetical protein
VGSGASGLAPLPLSAALAAAGGPSFFSSSSSSVAVLSKSISGLGAGAGAGTGAGAGPGAGRKASTRTSMSLGAGGPGAASGSGASAASSAALEAKNRKLAQTMKVAEALATEKRELEEQVRAMQLQLGQLKAENSELKNDLQTAVKSGGGDLSSGSIYGGASKSSRSKGGVGRMNSSNSIVAVKSTVCTIQ